MKLIQVYPKGKFCVYGIAFSCGSQLNDRNSERSIILDVDTILNTWFRQGNSRHLEVNLDLNCIYFSDNDFTSVRAVDIYTGAFTECENRSADCISKHIQVF